MQPDPLDPEDPVPPTPEEQRCANALSDFVDLLNVGAAPSVDLFLIQHPECPQDKLRESIESVLVLSHLFDLVRNSGPDGKARPKKMGDEALARKRRNPPK